MSDPAEMDDRTLLAEFAHDQSKTAFRLLVDRHSGWVYSAAFRQLRDAHLAEDATQAVFVLLCQRAKQMKPEQKLSGWLFLTLGYTVKSITRSLRRRQRHETLAALDRSQSSEPPPLTDDLDAAVARLPENERIAILLRFYQGLDFSALARILEISEDAARKRIARAIARLRHTFGHTVTDASLIAASAFGAPANSASLSAHVSQMAFSIAAGGPVPTSVVPALKGVTYLMAVAKAKIAAAVIFLVLLMGTTTTIVIWQVFLSPPEPASANLSPSPASIQPAAVTMSQQMFDQTYALQSNEIIRVVPPPFIKARMDIYRKDWPGQARAIPRGPDAMMIYWRNHSPQLWGATFGDGKTGYTVSYIITALLKTYRPDMEGDMKIADMHISGDIVVNPDATPEQLRSSIEKIFAKATGKPLKLTYRMVERPVIVFSGKWQQKPADAVLSPSSIRNHSIEIYGEKLNVNRSMGGGGSGNSTEFAGWLSEWIDKSVIIEAPDFPKGISWHVNDAEDTGPEGRQHAHDLPLVCQHIQEQTGLTWSEQTRPIRRLFIEPAN